MARLWLNLVPDDVVVRDDGLRQFTLDLRPFIGREGMATFVLDDRPGRAGIYNQRTGRLDTTWAEPRIVGGVEGRIVFIEVAVPGRTWPPHPRPSDDPDDAYALAKVARYLGTSAEDVHGPTGVTICRLTWDERASPPRWVADLEPVLADDRLRTTLHRLLTVVTTGRPSELLPRLARYRAAIRDLVDPERGPVPTQEEVAEVVAWSARAIRQDVRAWWRARHSGVPPPSSAAGGAWAVFVADALTIAQV